MKRKRSAGERLANILDPYESYIGRDTLAVVERFLRRIQAEAWDECERLHDLDDCDLNPYRKAKKPDLAVVRKRG